MSHTDLGQPDLAAQRAAAGNVEFAEAQSRLLNSYGYRLGDTDLLASLGDREKPWEVGRRRPFTVLSWCECHGHRPHGLDAWVLQAPASDRHSL